MLTPTFNALGMTMGFPCRISTAVALILGLSSCLLQTAFSFTPLVVASQKLAVSPRFLATSNSNNNQETDAERLLRRARELKAQAEAETRALHESRLSHKQVKVQQLDKCIDKLFPLNEKSDSDNVQALALRLKQLQYSTDKLLEIVTRLHEREIKAKGIHQVEAYFDHNTHTGFERVSKQDAVELERVSGLIDLLIAAAALVDEEYLVEKRKSNNPNYRSHVEMEHWTVGECASILRGKIRELRREHEAQFQQRLHSFYEAQRKKDLPPPPEYMP